MLRNTIISRIAQPGSFYKRTLSVLRDIEAFEAKWFADMCQFVICNSIVEMSLLKYYPYSQIPGGNGRGTSSVQGMFRWKLSSGCGGGI